MTASIEKPSPTYLQFYFSDKTILEDARTVRKDTPILDFYTVGFKPLEELNYKAVYPVTAIVMCPEERPTGLFKLNWCCSFEKKPEDGPDNPKPIFSLTCGQVLEANLTDPDTLYDFSAYMSNRLTAGKTLDELLDNFTTHDHSDFEKFRDTFLYSRKNRIHTKW